MAIQVVKIREFLGHTQAVYSICKDSDASSFYSAGGDGMLVKWNMDEKDGTLVARHESSIYALFSSGHYLMSGTSTGVFTVFDTRNFKLHRQLQLSSGPLFDIMAFNDKILLATGEGKLLVLDQDFSLQKIIALSGKSLRKMELVEEGLAVGGSEGLIWILDHELEIKSELNEQELTVFALAYHKASKTLISGGRDATLKLYRDARHYKKINAHLLHIHHIAMNEQQTMYLTCSMDKTIKLWDAANDNLLKVIDHEKYEGHTSSVNKILWSGKNNFISCSDDRTLKCYEILEK